MSPLDNHRVLLTRRHFFSRSATGLGAAALATLLRQDLRGESVGLPGLPHFAPKAKRVIYLFQHGAPSQLDLFDYKPGLIKQHGEELPESIRMGQRLTGMTAYQAKFPTAPSVFKFEQHGSSGAWLSELLPHTARIADDISIVRTMTTEAINHDPAVTFFQTGFQLAGRPSIGSWISYGLGSLSQDLPSFVVMVSQGLGSAQALADRQWSSGFLPTRYQGVKFRSGSDPVLYLSNPDGYSDAPRRRFLDDAAKLNELRMKDDPDPEIATRIAQYEMAYRMQQSVPELTDLSKEPESTFEMYGPDSRKPGTYAANCILARRLAERGVRFIQLFHRGWDQHNNLPRDFRVVSLQSLIRLRNQFQLCRRYGARFRADVSCARPLTVATAFGQRATPFADNLSTVVAALRLCRKRPGGLAEFLSGDVLRRRKPSRRTRMLAKLKSPSIPSVFTSNRCSCRCATENGRSPLG